MMLQKFNDIVIAVQETNNEKHWYMTVEEAAKGYGVSRECIMNHLSRHQDEIRPGIEKGVTNSDTPGGSRQKTVHDMNGNTVTNSDSIPHRGRGNPNKIIIYREGIIKLGFFVRSKNASAFRQWATNLVMSYLDSTKQDLSIILDTFNKRCDRIESVCGGLRTEVDELKARLQLFCSETEDETIAGLTAEVKKETEMDGRAIAGKVRAILNTSKVYGAPQPKQVINVLKNMLGRGLVLLPNNN